MKVLVSFTSTQDFIIEAESLDKALFTAEVIWQHKESSQNDLLKQYDVKYFIDLDKNYMIEEEE